MLFTKQPMKKRIFIAVIMLSTALLCLTSCAASDKPSGRTPYRPFEECTEENVTTIILTGHPFSGGHAYILDDHEQNAAVALLQRIESSVTAEEAYDGGAEWSILIVMKDGTCRVMSELPEADRLGMADDYYCTVDASLHAEISEFFTSIAAEQGLINELRS